MICYALEYDIPNHYEKKYRNGEFKMRNTFKESFFIHKMMNLQFNIQATGSIGKKTLLKRL